MIRKLQVRLVVVALGAWRSYGVANSPFLVRLPNTGEWREKRNELEMKV